MSQITSDYIHALFIYIYCKLFGFKISLLRLVGPMVHQIQRNKSKTGITNTCTYIINGRGLQLPCFTEETQLRAH